MKKINLIIDNTTENLPDFTTVSLNELNKLFSCSVAMIHTGNINSIPPDNLQQFLDNITDKVTPGGQIIFKLLNYKKVCYLYLNGNISENDFFAKIKTINNNLNLANVLDYCNQTQKLSLVESKKNNDIISVTLVKTSI